MIEQLWKGLHFDYYKQRDGADLWTKDLDPDVNDYSDRFSIAGTSFLAIVAKGDMIAGLEIGSIFLEYDIEFFEPKLAPAAITSTYSVVYNDPTDIKSDGSNPLTNLEGGGTGKLGIVDTAINVVQTVVDEADSIVKTAETVAEGIETLRDAVSWGALIPTAEDIKHYPTGSLKTGRFMKYGAAPTEQPGLGLGHYAVKVQWWTESSTLYTDSSTLLPQWTFDAVITGGSVTRVHTPYHAEGTGPGTKTGIICAVAFDNQKFIDPFFSRAHTHYSEFSIEFEVSSTRGFADLVVKRVADGTEFDPDANDVFAMSFTRRNPSEFVNKWSGGVVPRIDFRESRRELSFLSPSDVKVSPIPRVVKTTSDADSMVLMHLKSPSDIRDRLLAYHDRAKAEMKATIVDGDRVVIPPDGLVAVDPCDEEAALKEKVKTLQRQLALLASKPKGPT